jgi:chromosome partitioning protein
MQSGTTSRLLKTAEVAQRLGVDAGTVARYIREGILPATSTAGGHHRVYEADLEAFLLRAERTNDAAAVVIALVNQKGGVGKTTATANLGVVAHQIGLRVLLVDLDPQGHLTWSMRHNPDDLQHTIYEVILGDHKTSTREAILKTAFGPDLAPNNILASNADRELSSKHTWGTRLGRALDEVRANYDYILLDCGPTLNSLTINAMHAADYILIPTPLEMMSVNGLRQLLERIDEVRDESNPHLQIAGAVAMMVQQINANRAMDQALRDACGKRGIRAFNTAIKRAAQFSTASNQREVVAALDPRSPHTQAYRELLAELLTVVGGTGSDRISTLQANTKAISYQLSANDA